MNKIILKIIAILIMIIGIVLCFLPYISNYLYNQEVEKSKEEFIDEISIEKKEDILENADNLSEEESENILENTDQISVQDKKVVLEKLYQELKKRNEELFENKQANLKDPFSYEQVSVNLSKYGIKNNTIGYINIPKMKIELPILLGANTKNMSKGAVHLTETSYPIGGENTNSVIAAHRGWSWSNMFRRIENLEVGDKIYIQNFREKLTYEVYDIKIIDPTDIHELLIEEGKDMITLVTCHPYRVNTQRYIVRAKAV